MRSIANHLLFTLAILILVSTASAQDEAYAAWSRVFDAIQPGWNDPSGGGDLPDALLTLDDLNVISDYASGPPRTPTAVERSALARLDEIAPLLREATSHRAFDPGIDWSDGFSTLLPHLGLMRQSARCVRALARHAAANGDAASAAAWTGRIATMAGQSARDGTLIGSLVGGAIYMAADQELDALFGSGSLDRAGAAALLDGMEWFGEDADPFRVTEAMFRERDIMTMELDRLAERLDAGDPEGASFLEQLFGGRPGDFGDLDGDEVRRQATIMFDLQSRMIDAADDPDRARGIDTMRAIEAEIADAEDLALVRGLVPSLTNVLEMRLKLEGRLDDRLRVLHAIADGRLDPSAIANAAILWDRLGTMFETLPGPVQLAGLSMLGALPDPARIETLASRAIGEPADSLRSGDGELPDLGQIEAAAVSIWRDGIAESGPEIREIAMLAAALPTADFPISPGLRPRPEVESDELARLRGAGRGLLADAWSRLLAATVPPTTPNDPTVAPRTIDVDAERLAAAEDVVAVLALVHDLVADPALVHIVMAADLMNSLDGLLRSDIARPMLEHPESRDRITDALTAIPRPVMLDAGAAARADAELLVQYRMPRSSPEVRAAIIDRLHRTAPDRVHALLIEDADLRIATVGPDAAESVTPLTPWETPEDSTTGYRPLRLLASLEGMHGVAHVLARRGLESGQSNRVASALEDAAGVDGDAMPTFDAIVIPDWFPLERRAMVALDTIAGLDRLVRDIGRATPSHDR
jgi:hypothetical protein